MSNDIRIYGCGGAGISIAQQLLKYEKFTGSESVLFGEDGGGFSISFIDTSRSNFDSISSTHPGTYVINGLDGSGQQRDLNASIVVEEIDKILQIQTPLSANIIIHSLSGGSGSVIGPLLAKALILKKMPVVVIGIGDYSTRKFMENELATIKTYENISRQIQYPINMIYVQNEIGETRESIDKYILDNIRDLCLLFSGTAVGLDSRDIYHFLNYNLVSDVEPMLSSLVITDNEKENSPVKSIFGEVISVATLAKNPNDTAFCERVETQYIGINKDGNLNDTIHFIITDRYYDFLADQLKKSLIEFDKKKTNRTNKNSLVNPEKDTVDPSGLVL